MSISKSQRFLSVGASAVCDYIIERSVFKAYCEFAPNEKNAQDFIVTIKKKHYDANHNCYAYIANGGKIVKSSDDKEPPSTAGQPILEAIKNQNLLDSVVVVARYFGGIKLGTGGLMRAYYQSATDVLLNAPILEHVYCSLYSIQTAYENLGALETYIKNNDLFFVKDTVYDQSVKVLVYIVNSVAKDQIGQLNCYMQGKTIIKFIENEYYIHKIKR